MEAPDLGQGKNLGEVCVCVYNSVCLGEGYVCVSVYASVYMVGR